MVQVSSVSDTRSVTYLRRFLLLQLMRPVTTSNKVVCWSSLVFDAGPTCIRSFDAFLRNWQGDVESSASGFSVKPTSVVTECRSPVCQTVHPRCVLGNKNHSRLFRTQQLTTLLYQLNNTFRPNGPSLSWQEWKNKYTQWKMRCKFLTLVYSTCKEVELNSFVLGLRAKVGEVDKNRV
jgi:hypothetical protein